jgi:hypothetical protein
MTTEQYIQAPVGTTKQTDPFWYRKNSSATYGVTATPSNVNPNLGIEDIVLKPGSQAQLQHKILSSGLLKTIIGSISFQIKLSGAGAPFVQTISTENGTDEKGNKLYWEHIILKPAVKAQVLRFFEALQVGAPIQQPSANFNPVQNQFAGMNPVPQANPAMAQMQALMAQLSGMTQMPAQPQVAVNPYAQYQTAGAGAGASYPDYSAYANIASQNLVTEGVIPSGNEPLQEDDLPV